MLFYFLLSPGLASMEPGFEIGASWKYAFPEAAGNYDRNIWEVHIGAVFPAGEHFHIAAEYTFGGILYQDSGHTVFHGPRAGIRYDIYQSVQFAGYKAVQWISSFRESPVFSAEASLGIPMEFPGGRVLMHEFAGGCLFADPRVYTLYFRNTASFHPFR